MKGEIRRKLEANIWKYYLIEFLGMLVFFVAYFVYYFQELGLSVTDIMFVVASLSITAFIFEIPSGYIADRIGRKNTLLFGSFALLVANWLLYTSTGF